jgi:hypothetical protein
MKNNFYVKRGYMHNMAKAKRERKYLMSPKYEQEKVRVF